MMAHRSMGTRPSEFGREGLRISRGGLVMPPGSYRPARAVAGGRFVRPRGLLARVLDVLAGLLDLLAHVVRGVLGGIDGLLGRVLRLVGRRVDPVLDVVLDVGHPRVSLHGAGGVERVKNETRGTSFTSCIRHAKACCPAASDLSPRRSRRDRPGPACY